MAFTELHLFIDETGDMFFGGRNQFKAVGGIAVLGPLSSDDDEALRTHLDEAVVAAGGLFPRDLHGGKHVSQSFDQEAFLRELGQRVRTWSGDSCEVKGLAIEHEQDLWENEMSVLAERARDNRYQLMLHALLEQLLFVDHGLRRRLHERVRVHVTVASRALVLPDTPANRASLEAFGSNFHTDRRDATRLVVPNSFTGRELTAMLLAMSREFGGGLEISLAQVIPLDYTHGQCPAALYLADLYLHQLRQAQRPGHARQTGWVCIQEFRRLRYGRGLQALKQAALADARGDARAVLRLTAGLADADQYNASTAAFFRKRALRALTAPTESWSSLLAEANDLLDKPGCLDEGFALLAGIEEACGNAPPNVLDRLPWSTPGLIAKGHLADANHRGDPVRGEAVWRNCAALLPSLRRHGLEGLRLEAQLRNRRAVGLMDQFRFAEAHDELRELIDPRKKIVAAAAAAFGVDFMAGGFKDDELGACLGTLGQIIAVSQPAARADAADCFRTAATLFHDPDDSDRQWVYLGHLACDGPAPDLALWQEASGRLPVLVKRSPIKGETRQFLLALQLKGALVFGESSHLAALLGGLDEALETWLPSARERHPFGLIHQLAALGGSALGWAGQPGPWQEFAEAHFQMAEAHMRKGGATLGLLAAACRLRRMLASQTLPNELFSAVTEFVHRASTPPLDASYRVDAAGVRSGHFGTLDPGDASPPSLRAQALLDAIRFNYW